MMTRALLTFLVGLVVSLGALVSGGSGVAWAGNWNLSDTEKAKRNAKTASEKARFVSDNHLCTWAELDIRLDEYGYKIDDSIRAKEIERRSLNCFVKVDNARLCTSLTNPNFFVSRKKRYSAEIKRRNLNCNVEKANSDDIALCANATNLESGGIFRWKKFGQSVEEAKRLGLRCGVDISLSLQNDSLVCFHATRFNSESDRVWEHDRYVGFSNNRVVFVTEAKRRGLTCGVSITTQTASSSPSSTGSTRSLSKTDDDLLYKVSDTWLLFSSCIAGDWMKNPRPEHLNEAKKRGLQCPTVSEAEYIEIVSDGEVCGFYNDLLNTGEISNRLPWVYRETTRRGLRCEVVKKNKGTLVASKKPTLKSNSRERANAIAAQMKYGSRKFKERISLKIVSMDDEQVCAVHEGSMAFLAASLEQKYRGLTCGVGETASNTTTVSSRASQTPSDKTLQTCYLLQTNPYKKREFEKKSRVICDERLRQYGATQKLRKTSFVTRDIERRLSNWKNKGDINDEIRLNAESIISRGFFAEEYVCKNAKRDGKWHPSVGAGAWNVWYLVARYRGLSCGVEGALVTQVASQVEAGKLSRPNVGLASYTDAEVCSITTTPKGDKWVDADSALGLYLIEARYRGLSCGVGETTQTALAPVPKAKPKVTSAALTAAEKEAKRLRQELAALRAEKAKQQQTISGDSSLPTITIASASSNGPQGTVKGRVTDNTGIAEVRVDGKQIQTDRDGYFTANTYVPEGGVSVSIQAIDLAGLSSSMSVRLDRSASNTVASISFERLNPLGRKVAKNKDALALIIGVDGYKSTPARAIYADSDAKVFTDYASQKLGIPSNRIKTLVNDGAGEREMLLSVKSWLSRASKQGKSDVYVFFAGHGLASDDGQKMYLLPYDGAPELLEKTAILRQELFDDIASANPRTVTVFLDTCYSGTTRGTDMLIASRPIAIKALKQSVPDNFTVMTAAAGDQTAKPLEEAKHGMFSYFLMKGMEGEADSNQDNKITAGELHQYVQSNVVQQSSGSQTPELQGDENRVLVQFQ